MSWPDLLSLVQKEICCRVGCEDMTMFRGELAASRLRLTWNHSPKAP